MATINFPTAGATYRSVIMQFRTELQKVASKLEHRPDAKDDVVAQVNAFLAEIGYTASIPVV